MATLATLLNSLRAEIEKGSEFTSKNIPGGNLGLLALLAVAYFSVKYVRDTYSLSKTKQKILARQAKAEAGKLKLQQRLEQAKVDTSITDLPFADLQQRLQRGDLKAIDVLLAYQAKALEATRELNCVTDFIENAEARALALDKLDPSERGPLHGIPLSVKEAVGVKGYDCTGGISHFLDDLKKEDGILLQVLIKQGAVPFARTNLSQGQMSVSCSNPIFGETYNPVDKSRTCGGSTGGEGALIGAGASIIGLGCDMAGSIRIPCHFCGVCGMKPTPHRLRSGGWIENVCGLDASQAFVVLTFRHRMSAHMIGGCAGNYSFGQGIVSLAEVYGPMGRDVTSVVELFKASLSPQLFELDPLLPGTSWREELYSDTRPLRIGFYVYDGGLEVSPAVKRCVLQAKRLLESRGHTVVDFMPPEILFATEHLFFATLVGDDCEQILTYLKHDVVDPSLKDLFQMLSIPHRIRALMSRFSSYLHPVEKVTLRTKVPKTVYKWWLKNEEMEEYRRRFLALWKSKNIDAVICPVLPFTAFPRGEESSCMAGITYTSIYNVVGLPTGVVPAGKVEKKDLEKLHNEYPKRNQAEKYVHQVCDNAEGLPVGVQCVALPYQEEVVLRLMRELEEELQA